MRKSGVRIDEKDNGEFEITYMGVFSSCIPSQTLLIRSFVDLEDLYFHLQKVRADLKYNRPSKNGVSHNETTKSVERK